MYTCSVPDLEFDALAIELDSANLEVDADGGDERGRERVFAEAQQTARLAYARVANKQELDLPRPVSTLSSALLERRSSTGRPLRGQ